MSGIAVAHQHVGLVGARREIAKARDRPFQADLSHHNVAGDVVVAHVVEREHPGHRIAQHHVAGIGAVKAANSRNLPFRADLTDRIRRQHRIAADVVNFIDVGTGVEHDHIGRGSRRRRSRHRNEGRAVGQYGIADEAVLAGAIVIISVDQTGIGDAVDQGIDGIGCIDLRDQVVVIDKAVNIAACVREVSGDFAGVINARDYRGRGAGNPNRGGDAVIDNEAILATGSVPIRTDDLTARGHADAGPGRAGNVDRRDVAGIIGKADSRAGRVDDISDDFSCGIDA